MNALVRLCCIAIAVSFLVPARVFAQAEGGCGLGIQTTSVKCNSTSGVKTIQSQTCVVGGTGASPFLYCSQNSAYCQQTNGTEVLYYLANLGPDSSCQGCTNGPGFTCSCGSPQCLSHNVWQCPGGCTQCPTPPPANVCNYGEYGTPECGEEGWYCNQGGSPIVIDTDGKGFHFTSAASGVAFDIKGTGRPEQIAWTARGSSNAFLALDRDHNGTIDSGKELFGNFTQQPPSATPNGFLALADFDLPENGGNNDGIIDNRDSIFSQLVLWIDQNHDGISQPAELHKLPELGVYSLSLKYRESSRTDSFGNRFRYKAAVNPDPKDGESKDGRVAYDVFFVEARSAHSSRNFAALRGGYRNGTLYDGLGMDGSLAPSRALPGVFAGDAKYSGGYAMKAPTLLLAGLCTMTPALCAQQVASSQVTHPSAANHIELPLDRSFQIIEGAKCDAGGNIYARAMDVSRSSPSDQARLPISMFSSKGQLVRKFAAHGNGLDGAYGEHLFVSPTGTVYQVAKLFHDVYVVEFAQHGAVKSKTKLQTDAEVFPRHIAVFASGEVLLLGGTDAMGHTPYAAVFKQDGQLLKKIYEPEDEQSRLRAEAGDAEVTGPNSIGNAFVDNGDITLGSDGNAYFVHRSSPALVFAISSRGNIVRKFLVAASDSTLKVSSVSSYAGRLAFAFPADDHLEIQVTDLKGDPIGGYVVKPEKQRDYVDSLDLACYDASGFTVASVAAGSNLYLLRVKPQ